MKQMFGADKILSFLDTLRSTIEKQKDQLKEQISEIDTYEHIQEHLTGWRAKSSIEIQSLYDKFDPLTSKENKPDYDAFIQNITEEFGDDQSFKEKMKKIGEEINDLKEFIMVKIQDEISIYNSKA